MCRALGRHFLLRVPGPHHLNFQGPQAKFEGSLHWNTLPILQVCGGGGGGVHWAPQAKFHKGPIGFSGARGLTSGPHECPVYMCLHFFHCLWSYQDLYFILHIFVHVQYHKTSNIRRTLVGNKIVDHSDVVGASPVGAAPTTSSFST